MTVPQNAPPPPSFPWVDDKGQPTYAFSQYVKKSSQNIVGPLPNAVNDAAAATLGVPLQGLYRNGNAVQIRLK